MAHVFISYAHKDKDFAIELKQKLIDGGFKAWIDEDMSGGKKWLEEIELKIRESFAVVIVATPESVKSKWVNYEWIFARGANIEIIPIHFRNVKAFPCRLDDYQLIDFRAKHDWDRLSKRLQEITQVERLKDWLPIHTPNIIRNMLEGLMETSETSERLSYVSMVCKRSETVPEIGLYLTNALTSSHKDIVAKAAWTLGEMNNDKAMGRLLNLLQDEDDPMVLAHAAGAFGRCKYASAINKLRELRRDNRSFPSLEGKGNGLLTIASQAQWAIENIGAIEE